MVDFILSLDSVSKNFGGLMAVANASFGVRCGTILSVIGPNGAGKTTLFNLISGVYRDYGGRIDFDRKSITRRRPDEIAKAGIGRTFQNVRLFKNMTVLENVMVGANGWFTPGFLRTIFGFAELLRRERISRAFAAEMIELVGLADLADDEAESLPLGKQKLIEIARAMTTKPKLLLLDEPGAGLNDLEMERLKEIILKVRDSGVTLMLVEHDMRFVMGISDQVVVLNFGVKIAEGPPSAIVRDEQVMEAYLGSGEGVA